MARARNIKPGFFDNDKLALENDPLGRLLFIGLWTLADCNGNLEWRAARVKAKVLPYDDCDIDRLGINLDKSGFIRYYSDGDGMYVHIPNFTVHQNPHKNERERGAQVPEYSESRRQAVDISTLTINRDKSGSEPEQNHSDPADSCFLNPESGALNPDCGRPESGSADKPRTPAPKAKLTKTDLINDYGLPEDLVVQFLAIRKDKKQTLTPRAMSMLTNEFAKAGLTVHDGIALCCDKSWAGFKSSWDWRETGGGQKETPRQRAERMARERGIDV